jgi:hypothetical protein
MRVSVGNHVPQIKTASSANSVRGKPIIRYLQLVGQMKCLLQITRENILFVGNTSLAASWLFQITLPNLP